VIRDLIQGVVVVGLIIGGIWYWSWRPLVQANEKQVVREQHLQAFRVQASPEMRKKFAAGAEELFLDHRFDAQFSASGKNQTVLTLKVPYYNRLDVHTIGKSLDWELIKALGFRKVTYTDGEQSVSWDVP